MLKFTEFLIEGRPFIFNGKKYSSAWGNYKCDGEIISKEEYLKASSAYKGSKKSSSTKSDDDDDSKDYWNHIPTSKDYSKEGVLPGGSKYSVENTGMEVTYSHRDGVHPAGFTALKYNYSKDSKAIYKFYKQSVKNDKELNKDDFKQYAAELLWDNIEHTINMYGDKNAKKDLRGIQSKIIAIFDKYIDKNYDKISKAK